MFCNTNIWPADPAAEVWYLGERPDVTPPFGPDTWDHIDTATAEQVYLGEWQVTSEVPGKINLTVDGFWMWGDVLVHVVPETMLASTLYFFKRRTQA